ADDDRVEAAPGTIVQIPRHVLGVELGNQRPRRVADDEERPAFVVFEAPVAEAGAERKLDRSGRLRPRRCSTGLKSCATGEQERERGDGAGTPGSVRHSRAVYA